MVGVDSIDMQTEHQNSCVHSPDHDNSGLPGQPDGASVSPAYLSLR